MGTTHQSLKKIDQFVCNDFKLQMTLIALADKVDEQVRKLIYETYNNAELALIYQRIRASGIYQRGSKDKSKRKILEIPNGYVMQFLTKVFEPEYGKRWYEHDKALKHELVRPWWTVERL